MRIFYYSRYAIVCMFIYSCSSTSPADHTKAPPVTVQIAEIADTLINADNYSYTGTVYPASVASLGFITSGRVKAVFVHEGDKVHKGQILAALENEECRNALQVARLNKESAEDIYTRSKKIYDSAGLPEKDFKEVTNRLELAKAAEELAAIRLKNTYLIAPDNGIIGSRNIEPGSILTVGVNAPALQFIQTDFFYAVIYVPENELTNFVLKRACNINIPALMLDAKGNVYSINPAADDRSKTYTVKIIIKGHTDILKTGMMAQVTINDSTSIK